MLKNWQNVSDDNSSVYGTETTYLNGLLIGHKFEFNFFEEIGDRVYLFPTQFGDFMQCFRFESIQKCKKMKNAKSDES